MVGSAAFMVLLLGTTFNAAQSTNGNDPIKPSGFKLLTCAGGYEQIRWIGPNNMEVKEDDRHKINNTVGTLNITVVGENDVGNFYCENKETPYQKDPPQEVKTSPYVVRMDKSVNHVVDETAKLECLAWGSTTGFTIQWFKLKAADNFTDREEITNDTDGAMVRKLDTVREIHFKSQLTLFNLSANNYATYMCYASNAYGNSNSTILVRVKDKLAPLWPLIGICVEILVLILIIVIYEKQKSKRTDDEDSNGKPNMQSNANDHKGDENVRFRK